MTDTLPQLDGPIEPPHSGGTPSSIVVFLHGLGADGHDLISIANLWRSALPDTLFVSPHAHERCDMAPAGRQWFSLMDRSPDRILAGAIAARPVLDAYLDQLLETHAIAENKMALVGFSQGGMMALYTGLRRQNTCAGIAGYSTALVGADKLADEITAQPPILLIHGDADPVVSPGALDYSSQALKAAGLTVDSHLTPGLPHAIDQHGIETGLAFLQKAIGS